MAQILVGKTYLINMGTNLCKEGTYEPIANVGEGEAVDVLELTDERGWVKVALHSNEQVGMVMATRLDGPQEEWVDKLAEEVEAVPEESKVGWATRLMQLAGEADKFEFDDIVALVTGPFRKIRLPKFRFTPLRCGCLVILSPLIVGLAYGLVRLIIWLIGLVHFDLGAAFGSWFAGVSAWLGNGPIVMFGAGPIFVGIQAFLLGMVLMLQFVRNPRKEYGTWREIAVCLLTSMVGLIGFAAAVLSGGEFTSVFFIALIEIVVVAIGVVQTIRYRF